MIADLYRFGRELKQGRNVEASKVLAEAEDPLLREVGPLLLQPGGGADARETVLTLSYARLAQVKAAEEVFRFLARTTPAVGLMGTIVGLVNMLMNLKNFEQLGPAMAVAQLATFYGLILAYGDLGAVRQADRELRAQPVGVGAPARARPHQHRRGAVALRPAPAVRIGRRAPPPPWRPHDRRSRQALGAGGGAKRSATARREPPPRANDLLAYGEEDDTSWLHPLRRRRQPAARLSDPGARDVEGEPAQVRDGLRGALASGAAAVARRAQGEDRPMIASAGAEPAR